MSVINHMILVQSHSCLLMIYMTMNSIRVGKVMQNDLHSKNEQKCG